MNDKFKRLLLAVSGVGCFLSIAFAYFYLERTLYMNPCPLCMMQRLAIGLVGIAFLMEALFWAEKPIGRKLMNIFKYGSIFLGVGLASRHLYIQNLPSDKVPSCGLDFYGLMDKNSLFSGLWQSMQGTGECAQKDYFWGLTLPTWTLIIFAVLLVIAVVCSPNKK